MERMELGVAFADIWSFVDPDESMRCPMDGR